MRIHAALIFVVMTLLSCRSEHQDSHASQDKTHESMTHLPGYMEVQIDPERIQLFGVRT